jgi:peptidoglycan hydrolase-like protein with peptidoglycan-binding domain
MSLATTRLLILGLLVQTGCTVPSPPSPQPSQAVVISATPIRKPDGFIQRVQIALVHLGYLRDVDIDGRDGPRTRAALVRFQAVNGISETPVSRKLLEQLRSPHAVRAPDPVPASSSVRNWLHLADQTPTMRVHPDPDDDGPAWVAPVPATAPTAEGVVIEPVIEDTATLLAPDRRFALAGVQGLGEPYTTQLRHYLDRHGGHLRCFQQPAERAVCITTDDAVDLGAILLVNGAATITPDASDAYQAQQSDAIQHRRGLWRSLASDPESFRRFAYRSHY